MTGLSVTATEFDDQAVLAPLKLFAAWYETFYPVEHFINVSVYPAAAVAASDEEADAGGASFSRLFLPDARAAEYTAMVEIYVAGEFHELYVEEFGGDKNDGILATLENVAHELARYEQWCKDEPRCEDLCDMRAIELVEEFVASVDAARSELEGS